MSSMINADFCVAGCLIAYGALLGKVSPVQLMVLTLFGITLFAVEEFIIISLLHVSLCNEQKDLFNACVSKRNTIRCSKSQQ